jgi:hypothetical protein
MKSMTSILALILLSLLTPQSTAAQTTSASGSYQFYLEDEILKYVEFDAKADEKGVTTGQMTFIDQAKVPDTDEAEDPSSGDSPPEFYMKAQLDRLTTEKNRAVMSGTVMDSSHKSYIGKWVQLVVEDNGIDQREPDRLMWAFCRRQTGGWVPADAELKSDNGAYMRWWATDAEQKGDVGIPSKNLIPGEDTGCQIYPLSSYPFADLLKWEGDIVVQP